MHGTQPSSPMESCNKLCYQALFCKPGYTRGFTHFAVCVVHVSLVWFICVFRARVSHKTALQTTWKSRMAKCPFMALWMYVSSSLYNASIELGTWTLLCRVLLWLDTDRYCTGVSIHLRGGEHNLNDVGEWVAKLGTNNKTNSRTNTIKPSS